MIAILTTLQICPKKKTLNVTKQPWMNNDDQNHAINQNSCWWHLCYQKIMDEYGRTTCDKKLTLDQALWEFKVVPK
jgi:hypothetical protein